MVKDITGQKFGMLTVLRYSHTKDYNSYWLCKCDCGNEKIAQSKLLSNGHIKSCGCLAHKINNLIGRRFGRLVVLSHVETRNEKSYWKCQCDCGNVFIGRADVLRSGRTKSCGCLNSENRSTAKKHGDNRKTKRLRLYRIWGNILQRCGNPNNDSYKHYGRRGITICPEWYDYSTFRAWALSNGYDDTLTIDRINNDGNYEPSNCRWTTMKVQANNTRRNKHG